MKNGFHGNSEKRNKGKFVSPNNVRQAFKLKIMIEIKYAFLEN